MAGVSAPYWRLSNFYFWYFASLGALVPYWSLYLKGRGFDAVAIGELMAILMATKMVAPNIWGWIADHTGQGMRIIRLASALSALVFAGIFFTDSYWGIALVMIGFSFFWNAALPQFEAVTLSHLGADTHRYSSIRLWGSMGFIVTVAGLGAALDYVSSDRLPVVLVVLFAGIWLASLAVSENPQAHHPPHDHSIRDVILRREVLALLAVCFLMQASHGPYYAFYTLYMEDHGFSRNAIGQLWALGVLAEIGVFLVMHRWLPTVGARVLLLSSLLLASLRWLLIALWPDHLLWVLIAQLLHAATFGVYHAVAIHLVHRYFVGRHQGRGQALYSSLSFGAGGAFGSLYAGYVWSGISPSASFVAAAGLSLMAAFLAWRYIPGGRS